MDWRRFRTLGAGFALAVALAGVAPARADEILVRGSVAADDEGLLEDAHVLLFALPSERETALARLEGREPVPVAAAGVTPDGHFELTVPGEGMWRLVAAAKDRLPMRRELLPLLEETTLARVELRRSEGLEVRVLDPDGAGVEGAWVRADPGAGDFWRAGRFRRGRGGWWPAERVASTDDRGIAVLPRAVDEELVLRAGAAGWVESEDLETRAGDATLELAAGRPVTVRAVDDRGAALAGVLAEAGDGRWPRLADDEGLVTVAVPADGKLALELTDPARRRYTGSVTAPATPGADPLELTLAEPLRLTGRVLDQDSRRPVAGALVWAADEPTGALTSDGRGRFDLAVEHAAEIHLQAARSGYQSGWLQVPERSPHEPVLALRPAAAVRGVVVDGGGRPVADAEIGAREQQQMGMRMVFRGDSSGSPRTRSDAGGRFLLTGLDPKTSYEVTARRDGFAPGKAEVPELEPLATVGGVRVVLETGTRLVGRVLDASGAPIAGARVTLQPAASGRMRMFRMMRGEGESDAPETWTDNEGGFAIDNVEKGSFDLEASADAFATTTAPGIEIPAAVAMVDAGTITLEPGAELAGRALDGDGQPVEGADVWAAPPSPMGRMRYRFGGGEGEPGARTAADGHFALTDRREGERVDVVVRRSGYSTAVVSGVEVPPLEPLEVTLEPASTLSGRIVDPRGKPVPTARIQAFAEGGGSASGGAVFMMSVAGFTVSDERGEFTMEDLEPGTVRLSVSARGFRETERSNVEVPAGEDVEGLEIELLEGATLTGQVRASDGQPVVGARVHLVESQRRMGGGRFGAVSDGAGNYFLEGLEPGTRLIGASHEDEGEVTREIEIEAGDNSLDLQFEGGVEVSGHVVDEAGAPLAGAVVSMGSSVRFFRGGAEERSGADGSFTFRGVRDGSYRLVGFKEGYAQQDEGTAVEVGGAPVDGVEVRLGAGAVIIGELRGLEPAQLVAVDIWASSPPNRWTTGEVRHDGTYRVPDVGPGDWSVTARVGDGSGQAEGRVSLAPGQPEALLDLEFGAGLRVTGRVLLGVEPVPGITVGLRGLDVQSSASAVTGRDGRFAVAGIEPGRHRVQIMDFGSGLQHSEDHDIYDDVDLDIALAVGRVSGYVVDSADSSPVAGAAVRLEPLGEQDDWARFFNRGGSTDAAGLFTIHQVTAGGYRLVAEKEGYAPGELAVQVAADRHLDNLEVALQATDGLALRVFLPTGRPASRVWAAVLDSAGGTVVAGNYRADQDGRLRLSQVPAGGWRLLVGAEGAAVATLDVVAPGTAGDVRLAPEARLEVLLPGVAEERSIVTIEALGAGGQPASVLGWSGRVERHWRTRLGAATLNGLAPGTWRIRATAPDGRIWEENVTLAPGANPRLVLE